MGNENYPYYVIPDIEALGTESDPEALRIHRRRIAAIIGDRDTLMAVLGEASEDFHDFYGTSDLPTLSTADTIDSFIEKFGKKSAAASAASMPDDTTAATDAAIPVAPAIDYASMMESQLPDPAADDTAPATDATLGAIDSFLGLQTPGTGIQTPRIKPKKEEKEPEMPSLTEGFAKIMIKNGNYRRALEIITEISLNNPEKSIYFADQIRFLRKAILIQSQ